MRAYVYTLYYMQLYDELYSNVYDFERIQTTVQC